MVSNTESRYLISPCSLSQTDSALQTSELLVLKSMRSKEHNWLDLKLHLFSDNTTAKFQIKSWQTMKSPFFTFNNDDCAVFVICVSVQVFVFPSLLHAVFFLKTSQKHTNRPEFCSYLLASGTSVHSWKCRIPRKVPIF